MHNCLARVTQLPWWVTAFLAPVTYFLLHAVAAMDVHGVTGFHDPHTVFPDCILSVLAFYGQFLIPFVFLFGAILSALHQVSPRDRQPDSRKDSGEQD